MYPQYNHEGLLDREIVLSRVFNAPRELVFKAWTEAAHISQWFGPKGFVTTTHEMDVRVGGRWRFDMKAPNGTVYTNRVVYLEIKEPELLVFEHGVDQDNDPGKFPSHPDLRLPERRQNGPHPAPAPPDQTTTPGRHRFRCGGTRLPDPRQTGCTPRSALNQGCAQSQSPST
jgi:uncharacterized protein YndB with AHSA1/START domain